MTATAIDPPAPSVQPGVATAPVPTATPDPPVVRATAEAGDAVADARAAAVTGHQPSTDETDRGFGKAIVIGSAIGIVVMAALIAGVVKVMDPDASTPAVAAIAIWTGIWAGLFLGGTVTVGRWSAKQH